MRLESNIMIESGSTELRSLVPLTRLIPMFFGPSSLPRSRLLHSISRRRFLPRSPFLPSFLFFSFIPFFLFFLGGFFVRSLSKKLGRC